MVSEITIQDIWPKLCELGIIEVRINDRTVWSDGALDVLCGRDDYDDLIKEYFKCAEEEMLDWYKNLRITNINIKIVDFHHCVADIEGYMEDEEDV